MSQSPTDVSAVLLEGANGINDLRGSTKLPKGFVSFSLNLNASGDVWDRREGRDYKLSKSGSVLAFSTLFWDDGLVHVIGAIGGNVYDLAQGLTFILASGIKIILQSPDLNCWDVTPNDDGVINPEVVAIPVVTPQSDNFDVLNGQSIGFTTSFSTVNRLIITENDGLYTKGYIAGTDADFSVSTDLFFEYVSGFSLVIEDDDLNKWFLFIDNDGDLQYKTI